VEEFTEISNFVLKNGDRVVLANLPHNFTKSEFLALEGSNVRIDGVVYRCRRIEHVNTFLPSGIARYQKHKQVGMIVTEV
jgi:hypothetical protein